MTAPAPAKPPQLNARIFGSLARYLREQVSVEALEKTVAAAQLEQADLDGRSRWITLAQGEALLAQARTFFEDDDAFRDACAYKLADGLGALRFVLWAMSPQAVYRKAVQTQHLACSYATSELVTSSRTAVRLRYRATAPESRLLCLSRQAVTRAFPTLFGLPPAYLREDSCISRGDAFCDYHLRWYDRKRWFPSVVGFLGGLAAWAGFSALAHGVDVAVFALPFLGATLGYLFEKRRAGVANVAVREEVTEALRELARNEAEARQELLELHQRQREWTHLLEQDAAERSAQLHDVAERLGRLQEVRELKIRGFSHDLRNPLAVIKCEVDCLRGHVGALGDDGPVVIRELDQAIEQMRSLLADLMAMVTQHEPVASLTPERLEVGPLTDRLRRRLRALVLGKDIRATVFKTREAPEYVETDSLLFDRVVDNLLTNASKYTEHGSIILEVDGTPELLTLKLSDTGRGIASEQLERVFSPDGSDRTHRAKDSYGVGLSVVVQLLGQVGGRLEVMSKPASGTTFWVHFPLAPKLPSVRPSAAAPRPIENYRDVLLRVVTIRRNQVS